jgi:hypothetical protein
MQTLESLIHQLDPFLEALDGRRGTDFDIRHQSSGCSNLSQTNADTREKREERWKDGTPERRDNRTTRQQNDETTEPWDDEMTELQNDGTTELLLNADRRGQKADGRG